MAAAPATATAAACPQICRNPFLPRPHATNNLPMPNGFPVAVAASWTNLINWIHLATLAAVYACVCERVRVCVAYNI